MGKFIGQGISFKDASGNEITFDKGIVEIIVNEVMDRLKKQQS